MEEEFARVLRTARNGQSEDATEAAADWSQSGQSTAVQLEAVLHGSAQDRLAAISAALRRLEAGTYGQCTRCGNSISFGRLSVMPEATFCVTCGSG
jgi:RNA polymerase-binding transcription factor DksA